MKNIKNTPYHLSVRIVHWVVSLIVVALLSVGWIMTSREWDETTASMYYGHKSFGALVFILMILRVILRLYYKVPPLGNDFSILSKIAARSLQYGMYVILLIMPISGYTLSNTAGHGVSFFGIGLPTLFEKNKVLHEYALSVHETLPIILVVAILLHIAASLKHIASGHTYVVKRML